MKKFFHPVDKRSRTGMIRYLRDHFRYPTMNSWNQCTSYACNFKIPTLGLDCDLQNQLLDLLDVSKFQDAITDIIDEFGVRHGYRWQAGRNGRGSGYLVMYEGGHNPSGYQSYCSNCGQLNYTSVLETGSACGQCHEFSRIDFDETHMQVVIYPGRSIDKDEIFEDWSLAELQDRVSLVQEFDRLADKIVRYSIKMARSFSVEVEEFCVTHTRKVLARRV